MPYPSALRTGVLVALEFLTWLDEHDLDLGGLRQDRHGRRLDAGNTRTYAIRYFLSWTAGRSLTGKLVVLVFVAEPQSWRDDHSDVYEQARRSGAWNDEFIAMFSTASRAFQEDLDHRGLLREYAVKDAMIAASFLMLAATEMGLATSPMNGWDEAKVKKAIGIGDRDDLAIALLVSVGYAAEERRHPGRRARERNVFHGSHGPVRRGEYHTPGTSVLRQ
ncbi:nitroreductase family protein [Streptomyces sp. NPDC060334]|uniref:nitroreductase family protein n=1 Tax=Streptomyces sp. NPDC060334 TaxID=3347099 RepID=UPI003662BF72